MTWMCPKPRRRIPKTTAGCRPCLLRARALQSSAYMLALLGPLLLARSSRTAYSYGRCICNLFAWLAAVQIAGFGSARLPVAPSSITRALLQALPARHAGMPNKYGLSLTVD